MMRSNKLRIKANTLTLILIFLLISSTAFSQTRSYELQGIGIIVIPAELELQSQQYRADMSEYIAQKTHKSVEEVSKDRFVFQQAGLNNRDTDAFKQYIRVIVTKTPINQEVEPIPMNYKASSEEMKKLNEEYKSATVENLRKTGNTLLGWGGVKLVNSNQQSSIKTTYLRRFQSNPPVVVFDYIFFKENNLYTLTLSCRERDLKYWQPKFQKIFNSFQIVDEG